MVKRILQWSVLSLLAIIVILGGFAAYLYVSPVPLREFDSSWYQTPRQVTEATAQTFYAQHRGVVFRAVADHFVHPLKFGRIIGLVGASAPDDSGDVLLYFMSEHFSSSADLHLLPVYCWSEREKRLRWKGLQDNSP
jgi:hypothetical protein